MPIALPIDDLLPDLHAAWSKSPNFILRAPTGSGKSTRVPRFLMEWKDFPEDKTIIILQPRRMAARLLARRVASELDQPVGQVAGYQIRFESRRSPSTRLLYVTEGLLLRMLAGGDDLKGVGAILFDEFHERHLEGDVGLGLALARQKAGWGGRIGIFSATLEVAGLKSYLPEAEVLESEGRQYPVEVNYLGAAGTDRVWDQAAEGFRRAVEAGAEGDILVFMPGKYEIMRTVEAIQASRAARGWEVYPLHGELDATSQDKAIGTGSVPRVIVSTNIAETSLTLPGIRTVIDCGLARIPDFDARRGVNTLLTEKISRASADQRAGRAGRVAPGHCFRLWSRKDHEHRSAFTPPEIQRLDLTEIRLQLLSLGQADSFPWLEPPPQLAWEHAGELLTDLGASRDGKITALGRTLARFPLHPRFSRILVAGQEAGCEDLLIAAIALSEGRQLILPINDKRKAAEREAWWAAAEGVSDLLQGVLVWQQAMKAGGSMAWCREWGVHGQTLRQASRVFEQLKRLTCNRESGGGGTVQDFAKCLLTGYVDHLAKRLDRGTLRCELVHGRRGEIRRGSLIGGAGLFVSAEVEEREFRGEATLFLGGNTVIERSWLDELYPGEVIQEGVERMDQARRRVERVERTVFRGLLLEERENGEPDPAGAAQVLAEHIVSEGWILKKWDNEAETWIRRLNVLARACPELEIKPIEQADRLLLIEQICEGSTAYKEVKDRAVLPVLQSWLPDAMLPLVDEWAPPRFPLPGGSRVKLRYEEDGTVVLPARIQQLYDVPGKSLVICQGKQPLRLEILAPNGRPVQITDDLDGFWTGQYPQIRKDLFGRYPKHEWR
ncbi:ATP-dependent helicase HrpB [Puniceicoccales bacterium CK1056]|uniref:ATP-dependent helicase HrpB n=1 Tax=Oceanipulchritudo coccoides TaxID=2706888 RepID=A0A6B2M1Z7_9BACT|nr:ATP-dependent helicase HrpB [Oceanipulchritudo coccoides]NDV62164.1 ATP-dependent helicase HrpB [Oceanipulchritudo coccoides]